MGLSSLACASGSIARRNWSFQINVRSNADEILCQAHQAADRQLQWILTLARLPGQIAASGFRISTETKYCWLCGAWMLGSAVGALGLAASGPPPRCVSCRGTSFASDSGSRVT